MESIIHPDKKGENVCPIAATRKEAKYYVRQLQLGN